MYQHSANSRRFAGITAQAWDEDTQEASVQEITAVHVIHNRPMVKMTVTYADGAFADDIFTTMDHPFFVQGEGWVEVAEMEPGDRLITADGAPMLVKSIEAKGYTASTYNLTVANAHTFFVGEERVWVHNQNGDCATGLIGPEFESFLQNSLPDGKPIGRQEATINGNRKVRDFDSSYTKDGQEIWVEAKSGDFWNHPKSVHSFKSKAIEQKQIAEANGKGFEVHSNTPIPQDVKDWLDDRGIPYVEWS